MRPFEISEMLRFVKRENYIEYAVPLKQYLLSIIDRPEVHRWKIYDALEFFMTFDSEFFVSLLKSKNMSIDDFSPPPESKLMAV